MAHYTASELIDRALKLADISNTDFLSHTEKTQYLNDSWKTVYQAIINNGDKQFVREVELRGTGSGMEYTEYELPFDLYQICSIQDPTSGRIIPRKSISESNCSGTYDIVNNTLRLYGHSYGWNRLVLTYWVVPFYISFPDKTIQIDATDIVDTIGNYALLESGVIINVITGDTVGEGPSSDNAIVKLGRGHVYVSALNEDGVWTILYADWNRDTISELTPESTPEAVVWNERVYYVTEDGVLHDSTGKKVKEGLKHEESIIVGDRYQITFDGVYDLEEGEYILETQYEEFFPKTSVFDDRIAFYSLKDGVTYLNLINEDNTIIEEELYRPFIFKGFIEYGILDSNGTTIDVKSGIPDTLMNFPADLYFSMIAVDCAIRFQAKQGEINESLNVMYTDMGKQFSNSLSQAGDYTRIKKVY